MHQIRNHYKGDGVSIYIHKNFQFKIRNDISINCKDIALVSVKQCKHFIVYRPPNEQNNKKSLKPF